MDKKEIFDVFYGKEKVETYRKFQEIENSIEESNELYKYFDEIKDMLLNEKSFIRVRGFRIICKLAKYDKDNKIDDIIDILLNELDDDKPTSVRQCLAVINTLFLYKPELSSKIENKLKEIDCSKYKDSMSPLIEKDIECILKIENC